MALGKAIKFAKEIGFNENLRNSCYNFKSKTEMFYELDFEPAEFEDAINMQLVQCQTYEQAEHFQQIKMWFLIL